MVFYKVNEAGNSLSKAMIKKNALNTFIMKESY